jgi:hypothetical protein
MKKRTRRLPGWLEGIEHFIDISIPFMLVMLAVLIVLEFSDLIDPHHGFVLGLDYFIIAFFILDLSFKWYRVHDYLKFIKLYWIDLLAVFPFYTIYRLYSYTAEIVLATEQTQKLMHEAALLKETKILQEAERGAKIAREGRFIRVFARALRVLRARWYVASWHMHAASSIGHKKKKR